jgi:hypothetical protein
LSAPDNAENQGRDRGYPQSVHGSVAMIDAAFGWSRLRRNEGKVDYDEGVPCIRRRTDVLSLNGLAEDVRMGRR